MSASVRKELAFNFLVFMFVRGIQNPIENYTFAFDVLQGLYWFNYDASEYIKHVPFSNVYCLTFLHFFCTSTEVNSRRLDSSFFSRW